MQRIRKERSVRQRLHMAILLGVIGLIGIGGAGAAQTIPPSSGNSAGSAAAVPPAEGSWRFIVSGDSRNCGDLVMPAIAAHSRQFAPEFYWHLGDLRAIYKIDEDMAYAAQNRGQALSCDNYQRTAWDDFVENQIAPFGDLPFYVGIGNHEVIAPKNEDAFKRHFFDWLNLPALQRQRELDGEPLAPEPYYHWIQGGVDFIYLDNASGFFPDDELTWLVRRLQTAKSNAEVKSVIVGMHEALPDSLANGHSMGENQDEPRARPSGENAYKALQAFHKTSDKPVYLLASHSHFYMENIFNTDKLKQNRAEPLPGWIVGTGGAVRYKLPDGDWPTAKKDVYGYLVGTVSAEGKVQFSYQEVRQSHVPQSVQQRYPATLVAWCFEHNSQNKDPGAPDITSVTPRCTPPAAGTGGHSH
jgi:hypothetical protein